MQKAGFIHINWIFVSSSLKCMLYVCIRMVNGEIRKIHVLLLLSSNYAQYIYMSLVMRKPAFCICENKDADQLCGNREADQSLCFCYIDSTIPLLPKSEISSLQPSSLAVQPSLCLTWWETLFLRTRLICICSTTGIGLCIYCKL